jgi:hypothetical protein
MRIKRFFLAVGASFTLISAAFAENETDWFFARALAKTKPQKQAMFLCFDFAAIKFAVQTCEPAETVVEAAFGACHSAEEEYVADRFRWMRAGAGGAGWVWCGLAPLPSPTRGGNRLIHQLTV